MTLPATLVTGALGAGKTTLVNHLLASAPELRIGVLVNDFGEVSIDRELIVGATDEVVSLANGCLCCSLRGDLMQATLRVLEGPRRPEHLLVEASGVSNPGPLLEGFRELERAGLVRLSGVVAVLDAARAGPDALRTEPLLRDQLYASDLAVLNKADLAPPSSLAALEAELDRRLPGARRLRAVEARLPPEVVLGLERRDRPGAWLAAPHAAATGFVTATVEAGGALGLDALGAALEALPAEVLRVKGVLAVRERPGERLGLNAVGRRSSLVALGPAVEARCTLVGIATAALGEPALRAALGEVLRGLSPVGS